VLDTLGKYRTATLSCDTESWEHIGNLLDILRECGTQSVKVLSHSFGTQSVCDVWDTECESVGHSVTECKNTLSRRAGAAGRRFRQKRRAECGEEYG